MRPVLERARRGGVAVSVPRTLACLILCSILAGPSWAQSLTDGPLAEPGTAAPSKPVPRAKPSAKGRSAKKTSATRASAADLDDGHEGTVPPASKPAPRHRAADPLSLGMKWNGSNDNAEQTRSQNYGGSAVGTGASVGLRYHF